MVITEFQNKMKDHYRSIRTIKIQNSWYLLLVRVLSSRSLLVKIQNVQPLWKTVRQFPTKQNIVIHLVQQSGS